MHAPTGSSSNIVLKEDSEDITKDTSEEEKESKDKRKEVKPLKTKPYKRNTGNIKKKEAISLTKVEHENNILDQGQDMVSPEGKKRN